MSPHYRDAVARLNSTVMESFGLPVVMIIPGGQRIHVTGDWRQEPVLIDTGTHGAVSTFQATIGIDLHTWPSGFPRIDEDWSGWSVEIAADDLPPDIPAGRWSIADVRRPGGGWIDLELTNHISAP